MPSSYIISGNVKDVDGSTNLSGVTVTCYNQGRDEWANPDTKYTTGSDGNYTMELANMVSQWVAEDPLYLLFLYYQNGRIIKSSEYRITLAAGGSSTQNAIMKPGGAMIGEARVTKVNGSNRHSSALRIDLYDRRNDSVYMEMNIPATDSEHFDFGGRGVYFEQGLAKVLSDDTASRLTCNIKIEGSKD